MKIAVLQMSATGDPDQKFTHIQTALQTAAAAGVDLLVAPELALTGYGRGDVLRSLAQPANGDWVTQLRDCTTKYGISLVAGFPERAPDGHYISAMILNHTAPDTPRFYRKGNLYGDYEKALFLPHGPSTILAKIQGLTVGVLICYDVEFPENVRRLALAGAQIILVPTALPKDASSAFIASSVIPVRAFENQVFLAYANHADADEGFAFQGMSSIAAPNGDVLAMAPATGDALIYAQIDPGAYAQTALDNPYLTDLPSITGD